MDLMTIVGLLGGVTVIVFGMIQGQSWASFLNAHGVVLVLGGTIFATMINSSARELWDAFLAGLSLLKTQSTPSPEQSISQLVRLAQKARRDGAMSLKDEARHVGDGFFSRAIQVSLSSPDQKTAYEILAKEINMIRARHREVGNLFRTMGLLGPMFGLLGTLIGIVSVLKNMSDPRSVGPSMALALSSAFYGILFANLICVPVAGKLRMRSLNEAIAKELIVEGILAVVFTNEMPLFIQTRLHAYLQKRQNGESSPPEKKA
ncbi:MAG TPA: MotA/TolQ/ExbB proton channel family protein [Elusimicrobiota bacterium]|nr:MotA/TolQ/ExbB proton channel family protein [Elusimicrobiota bacterium]